MRSVMVRLTETDIDDRVFSSLQDYILNFNGVEAMVNALNMQFTSQLKSTPFSTFTVAGQQAGQFKNAGTFSYVRIYGA